MDKRFLILSLIYLVIGILLSQLVIRHTKQYKSEKEAYAETLFFKDRMLNPDEWMGDKTAQKRKIKKASAKLINAEVANTMARQYALYLALITLVYLILSWMLQKGFRNALAAGLIVAALVCLYAGLFTPMLELSAYERDLSFSFEFNTGFLGVKVPINQQFAGDMFFYYQSKSVTELIQLLFEQRNWIVGISILLFSVILPLGKILSTLAVLLKQSLANNSLIAFWIHKTGKWSMADVFVVAMFLSFLAFSNMQVGIKTESNVMLGLYFFFAYVVLSIFASQALKMQSLESTINE